MRDNFYFFHNWDVGLHRSHIAVELFLDSTVLKVHGTFAKNFESTKPICKKIL